MTEIKLFNEWLETNELSTAGITLWYGLMFIANRSGWRPELSLPISAIMLRTKMSRSAIYRERNSLRNFGLIEFDINEGRQSSNYRIRSFENDRASQVVFPTGSQSEIQSPEPSHFVSHPETQIETQIETQTGTQAQEASPVASRTGTQDDTETGVASHTGTQGGSIYKHKQSISKKKNDKIDMSAIGDPVWEELIRTWLDYKQSRNESYKSDLSVRKFHTMLRNLSRGDPEIAGKIIDKSIANNWAGIFELSDSDKKSSGQPATGQRIGQIKQPEDEARRQKLLEKLEKKK